MIRAAAVALGGLLGLALVHCAGPRASGTKTNWFLKCDRNTDCGQELSCTCGLCTLPCATDAECEEGICSTLLEASAQCDAEPAARLCLPESNLTCSTFEVAADAELGVALTPACAMDGALVCEGFDQPVSGEYSTWYQDDMTAAVQDCEVARGEGALHYRLSLIHI